MASLAVVGRRDVVLGASEVLAVGEVAVASSLPASLCKNRRPADVVCVSCGVGNDFCSAGAVVELD